MWAMGILYFTQSLTPEYLHDGFSNERKDLLCFPFITLVLTMFQTAQFLSEVAFPFPKHNVAYKIKIPVFVYRTEQFNFNAISIQT